MARPDKAMRQVSEGAQNEPNPANTSTPLTQSDTNEAIEVRGTSQSSGSQPTSPTTTRRITSTSTCRPSYTPRGNPTDNNYKKWMSNPPNGKIPTKPCSKRARDSHLGSPCQSR